MNMTILLIVLGFLFINVPAFAQESSSKSVKPLYQLPDRVVPVDEKDSNLSTFLVGSDNGLFKITSNNNAIPLWSEGRVDQIVQINIQTEKKSLAPCWIMRTSKGILFTSDLENFEERNEGLPFLTIKKYKNKEAALEKQIQELKDICVNPVNNSQLVTATKDKVFYSNDAGKSWKSLGSMSKTTAGVKAAAIATIEGETVVFMSHPIFGLSYIFPDRANPVWNDVSSGFEIMPSLSSPDEIADILPIVRTRADGSVFTEIYISQTYLPRLYRFNWEEKRAELIYRGEKPAATIDGLTSIDNVILYTTLEGFGSVDIESLTSPGVPARFDEWNEAFSKVPGMINTAWIPTGRSGFAKGLLLNELWLLYPGSVNSPYAEVANGRKCIYASAYQCRNQAGIDKYIKAVKDRNMNGLVIDMKDDYGLLRYDSKNPAVLEKAKTSMYAIKLDDFISQFKKENIYMVARIVTFKDRSLASYAGGKYAVWDYKLKKPWLGTKGMEDVLDEEGNPTGEQVMGYYDENWVDPYSEEVWEYNIEVAKELIERGFDEIQFDYIRFPTDGLNLGNATYRWKSPGMDKESALISFLSYARENIDAPIGIDIYGANGWYRSGTRTGQDAEMLAEYVDVIGPMFYPSHFEQTFMNYAPAEDRTYRIYYYGSYRNTILCRNRAIIRPWIQSFYLGVSYDRLYYNSDYIKREFYGTRDSINRGYMCWNNGGDYTTTPADVGDEPYVGKTPEAAESVPKPAVGLAEKPKFVDTGLSILDTILPQSLEDDIKGGYFPFLMTPALPILPAK